MLYSFNILINCIFRIHFLKHWFLSYKVYGIWKKLSVRWVDESMLLTKSLQSCPTLCNPIDGSPSGSPIPGILQARTLEWIAISFSNAWQWKVKVKLLSRVQPSATPWTAAFQAPLSMGFSRQEYWSGVPLPSPGWKYTELLYRRLLGYLSMCSYHK